MAVIELKGLTKRFGDVTALHDVDLSVKQGEIFGFLGPNGAGKSTTIDILLDFVRPTAGTARVFGLEVQQESVSVRKRTGVLPDGYEVYERLTGRKHVQFAIDSKEATEDAGTILERVGLGPAADRRAGDYSQGMRQRLVLAMALVGKPDLLILDEPTTGLDPNGAREVRRIIQEERDRGATVFFSSHVLSQVEAVCDRIAILDRGRIVAVDTIDGLRESAEPADALTITADAVSQAGIEAVEALEGVASVTMRGDTLTVRTNDGNKTAILHALENHGAEIHDFTTQATSLEDLFARYTDHREAADRTEDPE